MPESPTIEEDQFRTKSVFGDSNWEIAVQKYDHRLKIWVTLTPFEIRDQLNTYYHQNRHMSWIIAPEGMGK